MAMDRKEASDKFVSFLNRCCEIGNKCYEIGSKPIVLPEDSQAHKVLTNYFYRRQRERALELDTYVELPFMIVGSLHRGEFTKFGIDGNDIAVTNETWIIGVIREGVVVKAEGVILPDSKRLALKVKVVERAAHV